MNKPDIQRLKELVAAVKTELPGTDFEWALIRAKDALFANAPALLAAYEDAERYRWLREYGESKGIACVTGKYGDDFINEEQLDAAIDAAMGDKP